MTDEFEPDERGTSAPRRAPDAAKLPWVGPGVVALSGLVALVTAIPFVLGLRGAPAFWVTVAPTTSSRLLLSALLLAVPLAIAGLLALLARRGTKAAYIACGTASVLLLVLALYGLAWQLGGEVWRGAAIVVLALGLFSASERTRAVSLLTGSVILVIAPVLLWLAPGSTREQAPGPSGEPPSFPVILVIFDELPVAAITTPDGRIDADRYPHLARLSSSSTVYTETYSPSLDTTAALKALMGAETRTVKDVPPGWSQRRDLIFAEEASDAGGIRIVPTERNRLSRARWANGSSLWRQARALTSELASLAVRRTARTDDDWRAWAQRGLPAEAAQPEPTGRGDRWASWLRPVGRHRGSALHYAFLPLGAPPWNHLADGRRLPALPQVARSLPPRWPDDQASTDLALARALDHYGWIDELIGELLDRLEATGIYDDALVVLTAARGRSFLPGAPTTELTAASAGASRGVPLIVKAPGQAQERLFHDPLPLEDAGVLIADLVDARDPAHSQLRELASHPELQAGRDRERTRLLARLRTVSGRPTFQAGPRFDLVGQDVDAAAAAESPYWTIVDGEVLYDDVDPQRDVDLLTFRGSIESSTPLPSSVLLALARDDSIVTTLATFGTSAYHRSFETVLPASALEPGVNRLDLYVIDQGPEGTVLTRTLRSRAAAELMIGADGAVEELLFVGRPLSLDGRYRGFLLSTDLEGDGEVVGWALDRPTRQPVERILVFSDGQLLTTLHEVRRLEWLERAIGRGASLSGFAARFHSRQVRDLETHGVRVFAVVGDRAGELEPIYPEVLESDGRRRLLAANGRSFPFDAADDRIDAWIDTVNQRGRNAAIFGWAGSQSRVVSAEKIVAFRDGRYFSQQVPDTIRRDLVKGGLIELGFEGLGFRLEIPNAKPEDVERGEIELFALSRRETVVEVRLHESYERRLHPLPP